MSDTRAVPVGDAAVFQKRYQDMPKPLIDLGPGRPRLWLRPGIGNWARDTGRLAPS